MTKVTIRLIDDVMELASKGVIELSQSELCRLARIKNLEADTEGHLNDFHEFLVSRQDIAKGVGKRLVTSAFAFLDKELDTYAEIKKQRSLTQEELEYGRNELRMLLQSIIQLCGIVDGVYDQRDE